MKLSTDHILKDVARETEEAEAEAIRTGMNVDGGEDGAEQKALLKVRRVRAARPVILI